MELSPNSPLPSLVIETDASLAGWGAWYEGAQTGGLCSGKNRGCTSMHWMELIAATLAVKSFTKRRKNINILIRTNNSTAKAYCTLVIYEGHIPV